MVKDSSLEEQSTTITTGGGLVKKQELKTLYSDITWIHARKHALPFTLAT